MFNRPASILSDAERGPGLRDEFGLDQNPIVRLGALFLLIAAPLLVVGGKLATLQAFDTEEFIAGFESRVTESFEPIETTDGRILLDGQELARDVASYELKVHYRWLEEPADGLWLRRKAYEKLSGDDRSDREKREAAESLVLAERHRMWNRLAVATGLSEEEFDERRVGIQKRVERIVDLVERNRDRRMKEAAHAEQQARAEDDSRNGFWESGFKRIHTELTTPPKRRCRDPVEVREEFDYHVLARDLPYEQIVEVVTRPDLYPGVDFEMRTRRDYPQGSLAAHVVGTRQPVDADAIAARELEAVAPDGSGLQAGIADDGLRVGDRTGRTGVERSYDRFIRGRRGRERIVRNSEGEIILREIVRSPQPGADVELAIVAPLQKKAESLLDKATGTQPLVWVREGEPLNSSVDENSEADGKGPTGGCLIAINIHSGQVLCAAAAPRFDLRLLVDHNEELWQALQRDKRSPMFDRVAKMSIAPGSVFKTLTAIAGLESGAIDPEETVTCRGYLHTPNRHRCYIYRHYGIGHNELSMIDALCMSCNVYFYTIGSKMKAGPLVHWADRLGFGRPTGIDLPFESAGNVPRPGPASAIQLVGYQEGPQKEPTRSQPWYEGDTLGLAIGQSRLAVTPLQIARMMAAVATGEELPIPRVVRSVTTWGQVSGNRISTTRRIRSSSEKVGLSERTLEYVRAGLEKVVASRRGTGHRTVFMKEVSIAGKTGTAETGTGRDHGWFAGYAPAEAPQVAFVAVLEHGGSGGRVAGPLAKGLVEEMLNLGLIVPPIETPGLEAVID